MSLLSIFKGAGKEVASEHAGFGFGHLAFAHRAEAHAEPTHNAHAEMIREQAAEQNSHSIKEAYASAGHFIDWLRETAAYQKVAGMVDMLMTLGKMKVVSYLDLREPALAKAPLRYPPRTRHRSLDND